MACISMSKTKTGALIIITRTTELGSFEQTGEKINAPISKGLLKASFQKQPIT